MNVTVDAITFASSPVTFWGDGNVTLTSDISNVQVDHLQETLLQAAIAFGPLLPIIAILGLVGNMLSLAITCQPHNRHVSCCVYMGALAATDSVVLMVGGHYWIRTCGYFGEMEEWECKIICFMGQSGGLMGVLLITSMTVERVLVIRHPLKSVMWCTYQRARKAVAAIIVFLFIYCVPNIFFAKLKFSGQFNDCYMYGVPGTFATIHSYISITLNSIVPFFILLICNGFIIRAVRNRHKFFMKDQQQGKKPSDKITEDEQKSKNAKSMDNQLTRMLLLISFSFLVLTVPQYSNMTLGIRSNVAQNYGLYAFLDILFHRLFFLNYAINFFLYCIGGSRFRKDLARMCSMCGPCSKALRNETSSRSSISNTATTNVISTN